MTFFEDAENPEAKIDEVLARPGYPAWTEIKRNILSVVNKYSDI
jgi:hypothetical protein